MGTFYRLENIKRLNLDTNMKLPCGGTAYLDQELGISYRCMDCFAVVGSVGQPQSCVDEAKKYENWEKLGGKGWHYERTN